MRTRLLLRKLYNRCNNVTHVKRVHVTRSTTRLRKWEGNSFLNWNGAAQAVPGFKVTRYRAI